MTGPLELPDTCPACRSSLIELSASVDTLFSTTVPGYSRAVAVEYPELYDGALLYACPDCGHRWHRWPAGTRQHDVAELHVSHFRR